MSVWVKDYINKNLATYTSLCKLQKLYTAFKEKHPNVNTRLSKFCTLRSKWCVLIGSKMTHSVCVCSAHQNVILLVDAMESDLTYKDLIKNIVYNSESNKYIMHDTYTLCKYFTNSNNEGYKVTLIDVIDDLTRHSYFTKLKITGSWYKTKSKATTGVENTVSYILWLYTTWDHMVASNMIHFVLVLMAAAIAQAFCDKFKQYLFIIWKLITHIS